ncbi:MAG: hypothetical protein WC850_02820 [Candidatus Gracilibacteria bacterium]|jgi:hypothetical protein
MNKIEKTIPITEDECEILDRDITENGLRSDVMHVWKCVEWVQIEMFSKLKPALKYYEYISKDGNYAGADYILQISNKENIIKYDAIIEEYNADLKHIIEEKDGEAVINFYNRAACIMYGCQTRILDSKKILSKRLDNILNS